MRYPIILCLLLFLAGKTFAQSYWNKSCASSQDFGLDEDQYLILDTLQFDINKSTIARLNETNNIYELSKCLEANPHLSIKVFILMNTTYDTINSHFLRTRSNDIIRSLAFFNVAPGRYEVKDSIVSAFDEVIGPNLAYRKVIVQFEERPARHKIYRDLLRADRSKSAMAEYLKSLSQNTHQNLVKTSIPDDLWDYHLDDLIDQYYRQFFKADRRISLYHLIPNEYKVELGEYSIDKVVTQYYEELETTILGYVDITSFPRTSYNITYQPNFQQERIIYLSEDLKSVFQSYLGYEFKYDLDSMTNIPSNIQPEGMTKKRIKKLQKFINPRFENHSTGHCNAYVFWDFRWEIPSPKTISEIMLNQEKKEAILTIKNDKLEHRYIVYRLQENQWIYKETFKNEDEKVIWGWLIVGLTVVCFFGYVMIRRVIAL